MKEKMKSRHLEEVCFLNNKIINKDLYINTLYHLKMMIIINIIKQIQNTLDIKNTFYCFKIKKIMKKYIRYLCSFLSCFEISQGKVS